MYNERVLMIYMSHQEYQKLMNRSMSLIGCQTWDIAERVGLPKLCKGLLCWDPIFIRIPGQGTDVYYSYTLGRRQGVVSYFDRQISIQAAEYFNDHEKLFDDLKKAFDKDCDIARRLSAEKDPKKFVQLFEFINKVFPLITLSELLGQDEFGDKFKVKPRLFKEYQAIRKESDGVLYWGEDALVEEALQLLPESYKKSVDLLSFEEISEGNLPTFKELKKRASGYVYHCGQIYSGQTIDQYAHHNNFHIIENKANLSGNEVHGSVACSGKVRGVVRVVLEQSDMEKVKVGDILVTSMTTPTMITAMNRAAAFVTDEGGITCHAAIVAREFKKPCIIGTKVATKFLEDGCQVEVDADQGIVKILR